MTKIKRDLPNNQYQAAVGANNPSATNVFATIADLVGGIVSADRLEHEVKYAQNINKGQAVYVSGATGTNMLISKADNSTEATSSKTLGLATKNGVTNDINLVITEGLLTGTGADPLNTSTATIGDPVWLGTNGDLIYGLVNKPYAPAHLVFIGIVTRVSTTVGEIFVKVQNGFELDELHDVQLKGTGNVPLDGEVLTYEASTQLWKAKPIVSQNDSPLVFVIAATEGALVGSPNYYNGLANDGVGATLTGSVNGILSDGTAIGRIDTNYIPEAGDLILIKNQVNQFHNGVYEITDTGSASTPYILTRSVDVDFPEELYPLQVNVFQGLVNGSKYFTQTNTSWGNTIPPIIGFDNITFALTTLTTSPLQITFVDNATSTALPTCIYTSGLDLTKPGVGATLKGVGATGPLIVSGMTAGSSTTSLTQFTTLLVKNQAEPRHNGTYQVINPGSATTSWVLRRIDDLAAGFNKALRIVFCSHNVSAFAGTYFTPTWNPTLLNKNIGDTTLPLATNRIDYATYAPQNGRFGIANANGAYTYYATFPAAMTAAVSGNTIEMFADVTETACIPVQLKNNVNINFNGHTYTMANSACVINAVQDAGIAVNCTLSNGTIVRTLGQGSALSITGASVIRGDKLNLIGTVLGVYGCLTINNANANVYNMFCRSAGFATLVSAGSLYDTISISLNGIGINNTGLVSNCTAVGTGAQSLLNNSGGRAIKCTGYNGTTSIQNSGIAIDCTAISNIGGAFTAQPNSTSINCTAYSSASFAFGCNGNSLIQNCKGVSTAGIGISMINGKINSCTGYSATTYAISTTNSGATISEIVNCHAISLAFPTISAANINAGSTIHKTMVECLWATSAGHAIDASSSGANLEVVQCFLRTANTSANAINSTVAKTVNYSQNAYKGMIIPINANVTQGITNTQDNQGNILI